MSPLSFGPPYPSSAGYGVPSGSYLLGGLLFKIPLSDAHVPGSTEQHVSFVGEALHPVIVRRRERELGLHSNSLTLLRGQVKQFYVMVFGAGDETLLTAMAPSMHA